MHTPTPLALGRFRQLPHRMGEVWQGSIRRLPAWVDDPDDPAAPPHRPLGAFWISLRTGLIHIEVLDRPGGSVADLALDSFLGFGLKWAKALDGRPSRVEVTDPELRAALLPHLDALKTLIALVETMPALDAAYREVEAQATGGQRWPGVLETPGITVERLRAFADAAAEFYRARPWQHLVNEDLLVVESPKAPKGMTLVSVLGQGGEEFGLSFFANRRSFDRIVEGRGPAPTEVHGVTFGPVDELPFADVDAWEAHGLPVAAPRAYPLFMRLRADGDMTRPSAGELTFAEALLRALARVTEDELDSGRWVSTVDAFGGSIKLTLTLPQILIAAAGVRPLPSPRAAPAAAERANAAVARILKGRPEATLDDINAALARDVEAGQLTEEAGPRAALTLIERAQELAYDAMEAPGRLRIALARRALALSEACADAWVILGDAATDVAVAEAHYERGVDAGRRAIGDGFPSLAGEFWLHLETRPYMRARLALGLLLVGTGRQDEARAHYEDLLRLNPGDNQGVRYLLLPLLFERGHDEAAGALLAQFADDARAMWPYAALLRTWRREGESRRADLQLAHAVQANPYVVEYLLAPESIPDDRPPFISIGGRDDAASVAAALLPAFQQTPGLLDWLAHRRPRSRSRRTRRR